MLYYIFDIANRICAHLDLNKKSGWDAPTASLVQTRGEEKPLFSEKLVLNFYWFTRRIRPSGSLIATAFGS